MEDKRRKYAAEFKKEALEHLERSGRSARNVAKDLGIDPGLLCRWRRESQEIHKQAFTGQGNARDQEMTRLKKENDELREANAILKDDMFPLAVQRSW